MAAAVSLSGFPQVSLEACEGTVPSVKLSMTVQFAVEELMALLGEMTRSAHQSDFPAQSPWQPAAQAPGSPRGSAWAPVPAEGDRSPARAPPASRTGPPPPPPRGLPAGAFVDPFEQFEPAAPPAAQRRRSASGAAPRPAQAAPPGGFAPGGTQENWHTAALAGFAGRCHQEGSAKHSLRSPSNDITFGDFAAPEADSATSSVRSGAMAVMKGHSSGVNAVAWSPDGLRFATGSAAHTACIYQPCGQAPWEFRTTKTLRDGDGPGGGFRALAFSPEGGLLAAAGESGLRIWQDTDAQFHRWETIAVLPAGSVRTIDWCPSRAALLTSGDDGAARIWQVARQQPPRWELSATLGAHCGGVRAAAWSPSGDSVLTGSADTTACVWRRAAAAGDWELSARLIGHEAAVRAVAWSPDGGALLTAGDDATVRVWRTSGEGLWEEVAALECGGGCLAAVWAPDGCRLAAAGEDSTVLIWELCEGDLSRWRLAESLQGHTGAVVSMAWCPEGRRLLTGGADRTARMWHTPPTL